MNLKTETEKGGQFLVVNLRKKKKTGCRTEGSLNKETQDRKVVAQVPYICQPQIRKSLKSLRDLRTRESNWQEKCFLSNSF